MDKTGLVSTFDSTLDSPKGLVMVSRPRRFGKSFAAQSLVAFYSCGCDSRILFEGREVSQCRGWDAHLNRYNVITLDMSGVIQALGVDNVVPGIASWLLPELRKIAPDAGLLHEGEGIELKAAIQDVVDTTGRKFVFVIDEWDAPYRLAQEDTVAQDAYAEWLRALFKDSVFTPNAVAGAYLTGILPIKKYSHQSAVSDFWEYTMVGAGDYAPYIGFSESDVKALCCEHGLDLDDVRRWYDGYGVLGNGTQTYDVYAPYSVMRACAIGRTGSYWPSTETYRLLIHYIDMNFDGLQDDLVRAIGGDPIDVNPDGFQNDMVSIESRDDVLTLLVHLGYLAYNAVARAARVPNGEVRRELVRTVRHSRHPRLQKLVRESSDLLRSIVDMDEKAVADGFARVHQRDCHPLFYNDEQALRAVVKTALVAAIDEYARVEELPGGRGYADVVYLPRRGSRMPALVVELKWNKHVEEAVNQIRQRGYQEVLEGLGVPMLLVGITYDPKTREHTSRVELA